VEAVTETASSARFLTVEEAAELLRCSTRSVHERTRLRELPCRRLPGTRRVLFRREELEAWVESGGAVELEVVEGLRGGFVVRPRENGDELRVRRGP
jgi:excisionase family DNA binding protein